MKKTVKKETCVFEENCQVRMAGALGAIVQKQISKSRTGKPAVVET